MNEKVDSSFLKGMRISVLMGGWSSEREISLISGHAVKDCLREMGFDPLILDLTSEEDAIKKVQDIDIAFIALHGKGGEDGFIQSLLEERAIIFTGSHAEACKTSINKAETKKVWRELSLPTPDFVEIKNAGKPDMEMTPYISGEDDITSLDKTFVVKPISHGSSKGVSIVRPGHGTLEEAMKEATKYDRNIITEAFVEGVELTVPILDQKPLVPISIHHKNEFYDYEAKYLSKETEYLEAKLSLQKTNEIKDFAWHAFSSLGCRGWGRVDLIQDQNENFQLIELNTVPGLTRTSLVPKSAEIEGISFDQLITRILYIACQVN